ncbi:methylated-DNA--[protein]-cysteine S-methyltransferase [Maritalea myrionectae]|uniref:methylated-DNA--[protein]-cysteine S-methyltransferase n=1 Tax=Maritalea myrionectae TaxID=454601 RepID=A0A2R4M9X7_9HYPH|nr:methylated-DNA--[protein]-cysteine S-methyltransferase [Maritalea myrionectae]AVX02812.1 methylated-DNA--[protein]-cysteine S-methyltransferase [Maritalea myrionectae]
MDQTMHQLEICASDYEIVRQVVAQLHDTAADEHQIDRIAADLGLTQRQLTDIFRRWAGLTPKAFSHCITLDRARKMLKADVPIFDASLELGLSSPARLYDLFVTHEAMPPGLYKAKGEGLEIRFGFHPSPFGQALLMVTDYGLAGLAFADAGQEQSALEDMQSRWPKATYIQNDAETGHWADRIFLPHQWQQDQPIRVAMIGTDFEVRVWQTLLKIKPGEANSYGAIAEEVCSPKAARAVGAAVGRNPISFVVPCHRVIGKNAALTGYHWGLTRKKAMLGWEAGQLQGGAG